MSHSPRKTFTEYKLSNRQLMVLSQIVHKRHRNRFGPTLDILVGHDLIAPLNDRDYIATQAGVDALAAARREGW